MKIKSQDDIINEFICLGNGMKKITKDITNEDWVGYQPHKTREILKKHPIDIVAKTSNFKVGYEVWYNVPAVSNIIHKINLRKSRKKEITHWAVIIPDSKALEYGSSLKAEQIYTVAYDLQNNRQIKFLLMRAFDIK